MNLALAKLRISKGWSQVGLATRAGVSLRSIFYYENKDCVPNLKNAIKIARELGITTVDELERVFIPESKR